MIKYLALLLLLASTAMAGEIRLTWDHNEPLPEGYRVFMRVEGQQYDYSQPFWQGAENVTEPLGTSYGVLLHFVVRAYQGEYESADSNEVSWMFLLPPKGFRKTE